MVKYSIDFLNKRADIVDNYVKRFGEKALIPYDVDIEYSTKAYEQCLKEGKSYEELYGKFPKDVIY